MKSIIRTILLMLCLLCSTSCDKLEASGAINDALPGLWILDYELLNNDTSIEVTYRYIEFDENGKVTLKGDNTEATGTYRAGDAAIFITYQESDGSERKLVWTILSFSNEQLIAESEITADNGNTYDAVVTLTK